MSRRRSHEPPAPPPVYGRALAPSTPNPDGTHTVLVALDPPPPHAAAADAFLAAGAAALEAANAATPRPPRLGETVLWRVPEEWRRWDVADRLGAEVPAVVSRVRPDGSLDLHPLPPHGAPALRVELTWGVAPSAVRPLED